MSRLFLQVWGKYANKLSDFKQQRKRKDAVLCLNELITNALELVPDCMKYMSRLHNQSVFNFCAIPQVCHRHAIWQYFYRYIIRQFCLKSL